MKLTQMFLGVFLCLIIVGCKKEKKDNLEINDVDQKDEALISNELVEKEFNANALINYEYTKKIRVKDWKGANIGYIQNKEENYISLEIKKDSLNFFYARAVSDVSGKSVEGWLNKESYIGTYARNYEEGQNLNLYEEANEKSKIKTVVKEWIPEFYTISKFEDNWAYVSITYKGKDYSGWISPEMQCPNSYSTCN